MSDFFFPPTRYTVKHLHQKRYERSEGGRMSDEKKGSMFGIKDNKCTRFHM
jgi:hypothetical protein